jgi:hypothetical protein
MHPRDPTRNQEKKVNVSDRLGKLLRDAIPLWIPMNYLMLG